MTNERYWELEMTGHRLTQDEIDEGWHFCPDWDGMLVGPGMHEKEACFCSYEVDNRST